MKCVVCNGYIDSREKSNQQSLTTKEKFIDKLNNEEISDSIYRHAQRIWNTFSIKLIGKNQNLHKIQEALLLLAVVLDFKIDMNWKYYIEPFNFVTFLFSSLECTLKVTVVEYEMLIDINTLLDNENSDIGGATRVICHYPEANSKYMYDYDKLKGSEYIQYLDFNNQYGHPLSQKVSSGEQIC